jgi:hypothetical protein
VRSYRTTDQLPILSALSRAVFVDVGERQTLLLRSVFKAGWADFSLDFPS